MCPGLGKPQASWESAGPLLRATAPGQRSPGSDSSPLKMWLAGRGGCEGLGLGGCFLTVQGKAYALLRSKPSLKSWPCPSPASPSLPQSPGCAAPPWRTPASLWAFAPVAASFQNRSSLFSLADFYPHLETQIRLAPHRGFPDGPVPLPQPACQACSLGSHRPCASHLPQRTAQFPFSI